MKPSKSRLGDLRILSFAVFYSLYVSVSENYLKQTLLQYIGKRSKKELHVHPRVAQRWSHPWLALYATSCFCSRNSRWEWNFIQFCQKFESKFTQMRFHAFIKQYVVQLQITMGHSRGNGHGEDSKVLFQFKSRLCTWLPNPFSFWSSQLDFHQASDDKICHMPVTAEINRMKINFASTHMHLTHNTQTYQRKMKNNRKFEKNREYRRNLPNNYFQINFFCRQQTWNFPPLRLLKGRERSRDRM